MIARLPVMVNAEAVAKATGLKPKPVPNGYVLELNPITKNVWERPGCLPKEARVMILASERFEGSYAHVIAGMKGERFKPTHSSKKNKWQAQFCLNRFIDIGYDRLNDTLVISIVEVVAHDNHYEAKSEDIFVGFPEELPGRYLFLQDAIAACMEKAECKDCTHIHYSIGGMS